MIPLNLNLLSITRVQKPIPPMTRSMVGNGENNLNTNVETSRCIMRNLPLANPNAPTSVRGGNSTTGHRNPNLAILDHVQVPAKEFDDKKATLIK